VRRNDCTELPENVVETACSDTNNWSTIAMDQLVVEEESMTQTPVASSSQKKKGCGICGKTFTRQRNLRDHEETQHPDQNTPEGVSKLLKRTTSCNTRRRERRANDPIYKEKQRQISKTNRTNKKACVEACAAGGADVAASSATGITEAEKEAADVAENMPWEVTRGGVWVPVDTVPTPQPPPTAPMIVGVEDEDGVSVEGERVKKAHKKDNTTGVPGRIETTALTTANVASFFVPKYDPPRSKEQRAANPRPSAI
jgi:hypothetical protein